MNLKELFKYFVKRKKFVLAPIFIVMLLLGLLIAGTQGSAVSPFIYALF